MSHISKIKTQIKSSETLQQVLQSMGCKVTVGKGLEIRNSFVQDNVDMIVDHPQSRSQDHWMGYKVAEDGTMELVGDAWGTGINMETFSRDVTKGYAKQEVINQFNLDPELADFNLSEETVNDKGETVLKFTRW